MDVCGAPALTRTASWSATCATRLGSVAVIGGAGKSGSMSLAAARRVGARTVGVVPIEREAPAAARESGWPTTSRSPTPATRSRWRPPSRHALGGPADVTVVCVDVPGCEHGAILATADRGTVIFFSMATSFSAAALGAEGLAADVTMLVGNGYVPGHADDAPWTCCAPSPASAPCSSADWRSRGFGRRPALPVPGAVRAALDIGRSAPVRSAALRSPGRCQSWLWTEGLAGRARSTLRGSEACQSWRLAAGALALSAAS